MCGNQVRQLCLSHWLFLSLSVGLSFSLSVCLVSLSVSICMSLSLSLVGVSGNDDFCVLKKIKKKEREVKEEGLIKVFCFFTSRILTRLHTLFFPPSLYQGLFSFFSPSFFSDLV